MNCWDGDGTFCGVCVCMFPSKTIFVGWNPSFVLDFEVAGAPVPIELDVFISQGEKGDTERVCLIFHSVLEMAEKQHGKRWRHGGGGCSLLVAGG